MTLAQTAREYDARIRRAQLLADKYPFAAEVLRFYGEIALFQRAFVTQLDKIWQKSSPQSFSDFLAGNLDAPEPAVILLRFASLLSTVECSGPGALSASARQIASLDSDSVFALLSAYRQVAGRNDAFIGAFAQFIPRAFTEPLAEFLAARTAKPPIVTTMRTCPVCGSRPLLGVLRPEGDGGKRYLICSFCLHEWEFRRIFCAECGETEEAKLPVYIAEEFPHVRVETCDTCKTYLRSIDLTKDGNAIPIVDDLAAIPLTLWAHEHGYSRRQPNLLGT